MTLDEYKFNVIIDDKLFDGYLRILDTPIVKFNRTVIAYLELKDVFDIKSGCKKITIIWPKDVYPYVLNPSNVIFELDDQIILQYGITAEPNNYTTEHIIAVDTQINILKVYIFDDTLCQTSKTVIGNIGDITECNTFSFKISRSFNEYTTTESNVFNFNFSRSMNEYSTTECNCINYSFPRSFNENITTECRSFNFNFPRGMDYSILLE